MAGGKRSIRISCCCVVPQLFDALSQRGYQVYFSPGDSDKSEDILVVVGEALTSREVEVLQRFAEGQTINSVAMEMNISTHSVARYLRVVRRKLGARTTIQAVMKALRYGYIS